MIVSILALFSTCIWTSFCQSPLDGSLYPVNSLVNPGAAFPFGGTLPSPRVHHTVALVDDYLVVYGGYGQQGEVLDDVNLYHIPTKAWSSPMSRQECCTDIGQPLDMIASDTPLTAPFFRQGFQGAAPLPRAEHGACGLNGEMWMFGGVTPSPINPPPASPPNPPYPPTASATPSPVYLNDLYAFDPVQIKWREVTARGGRSGTLPPRRSGHTMVCSPSSADSPYLYVYGGRGDGDRALGDLWRLHTGTYVWEEIGQGAGGVSSMAPIPRQYASMVYVNNLLVLYGGMDPASSILYDELWAYTLPNKGWQPLATAQSQNDGNIHTEFTDYSYSPPPLFIPHLIPTYFTPENPIGGGSVNSSLGKYFYEGVLLFGGVGSGGSVYEYNAGNNTSMGMPPLSPLPPQTVLGQVYAYTFTPQTFIPPLTDIQEVSRMTYTCMYCYARLSADPSLTPTPSSAFIKRYGYEKAVFDQERGILYEVGGVWADGVQMGVGVGVGLGQTSESGGDTLFEYGGDVQSGMGLKGRVSLPYIQGSGVGDRMGVNGVMRSGLRVWVVSRTDMVLVREER